MDLWLGITILAIATLPAFFTGMYLGRVSSTEFCDAIALTTVIIAGCYGHFVWQRVELAQILPFSSLIVVANWFPLFAAFLIGLAWQRIPGHVARRLTSALALYGTSWYAVTFPMLGETPNCDNAWTGQGFCSQTTNNTCTPASAASLLNEHGIITTEQEMAKLCLTRNGTTWQGLYRGLKLKTRGTDWDVKIVQGDVADLIRQSSSPTLISVGLSSAAEVDGAYEREFGWTRGIRHSVLLMGFDGSSHVSIVDPNPEIGCESWTTEELAILYRGPAMQLVSRTKNSPQSN